MALSIFSRLIKSSIHENLGQGLWLLIPDDGNDHGRLKDAEQIVFSIQAEGCRV